jgi:L-lactate permease
MTTTGKMIWGYVAIAVGTLIFEFYIRLPVCTTPVNCAASLIKGFYLSVAWPMGWIVFLKGLTF